MNESKFLNFCLEWVGFGILNVVLALALFVVGELLRFVVRACK